MKKLGYLAVLAGFFACSEKDAASNSDRSIEFSYSLDTVMIDSEDEFIYLNWSLISSGLAQDSRLLYNFDQAKTAIQFIDLKNLVLETTLPLEVEGPNGIGARLMYGIYAAKEV